MKQKQEFKICYYCGQEANTIDHVIPRSLLKHLAAIGDAKITDSILGRRILKVPACKECNCLLSDSVQNTVQERKKYLKTKLKRRYQKILRIPEWREDELEEMGNNMRKYIEGALQQKMIIKQRLEW